MPSHRLRRFLLAFLTAVGGACCGAVHAADPPAPVADYFRRPAVTDPIVSPSGNYVAATMAGGANSRQRLVILDLADLAKSKVIAEFTDADVMQVHWVNDDRLVFSATDRTAAADNLPWPTLFAVARNGSGGIRPLIAVQGGGFVVEKFRDRILGPDHRFAGTLHDGSDEVLVARYIHAGVGEARTSTLLRLNTVTGVARPVSVGAPPGAVDWAIDPDGAPRAVVTSDTSGTSRLFVKPQADGAWVMAREFRTFEANGGGVTPRYVDAAGTLFATVVPPGGDTSVLMRASINDPQLKFDTLMSFEGYDFSGRLELGAKGRLLGIHYTTDALATYWFDPTLKKLQADVDAALPGKVNRLDCGLCDNPRQVLVSSWSDRDPGWLLLYDVNAKTLAKVAAFRPWIDPERQARREVLHFSARDGLKLPVTVTRPPGEKGPAPAVVLVHGGPWARAAPWQWDEDSQFLASRGYVVIEPEFRSSVGFGSKVFRSGFKQWGLAMQDDVADATRWAIAQGYADAKRVCIAGASYGGYATLMGLVRDPDLYRCGFEWVGVTDIDLMYDVIWSDFSTTWKNFGMPVLVGDQVKDAAQLAATSPIKLASKIRQPLLLAYGGVDGRVPIIHGVQFRDAVRRTNPDVEWVEYPLESHGWALLATDIDFWGRVERFLDKNLRNAPPIDAAR